jgi:hypothetical protein
MSALLDKLRHSSKVRAGASSRLAEGSLLSQALQRAHAERAAARNDPIAPPPPEIDDAAAPSPLPGEEPAPRGRGLAALLLAVVILVIAIAVWHAIPSPMPMEPPPQSLKLDHNLKGK